MGLMRADRVIDAEVAGQPHLRVGRGLESRHRVHRNPVTFVTPSIAMSGTNLSHERSGGMTSDDQATHHRDIPEERHMCPACIASTAVMIAGAGSTGGILAVCIGKIRKVLTAKRLGLYRKAQEK